MFKLNENETFFLHNVNLLIDKYIQTLPEKYFNFFQLKNGNRFRPLLLYYGYTLNETKIDENLMRIAFSIELIHKASTIIDDIIDQDTKRRELDSCHIQYSVNEAIILSIHMLGEAFTNIHSETNVNNIIGTTIKNMCVGTLKELNMPENSDLCEIKKIIDFQTTSIIKNCLLLGYMLNKNNNDFYDIEILGSKLGYLFQLLNDCESIFNYDFISKNKGNENFDYNRIRKNICITYLQMQCKTKEFYNLSSLPISDVLWLFDKYKIKDLISEEMCYIKDEIYSILSKLSNRHDVKRMKKFITYTINLAEKRANVE